MKNIGLLLDELLSAARSDPAVKAQLLATREQKDPLTAFCSTASSLGYPMDPGELIAAGEEYSCNQLKVQMAAALLLMHTLMIYMIIFYCPVLFVLKWATG